MRLFLSLLHTLTFRKILALLLSQCTFVLARFCGVNCKATIPPYVTIEPTNRCNLACPECVTGSGQLSRVIGDMSLEHFYTIVDQVYQHTIVLNLYMQGEPYLNDELPQMIAYAKAKGLFVSLSTNAQRLPALEKEYLPHHMVVSVDGASQESYAVYRVGGKLSKVQAFVSSIAQWKVDNSVSLPYVELQFLVHRENESEVAATKALFSGQYNRFVLKSMQIINAGNRTKFSPLIRKNKRYNLNKSTKRACYKMLSTSVFTQNGQQVLCCMDKNAEFVKGDILNKNYVNLLRGENAVSFRKMLIAKKDDIALCGNCPFT